MQWLHRVGICAFLTVDRYEILRRSVGGGLDTSLHHLADLLAMTHGDPGFFCFRGVRVSDDHSCLLIIIMSI